MPTETPKKDIPNCVPIICNHGLNDEPNKIIQNSWLPAPSFSICKGLHVNWLNSSFLYMNKCHRSHNYSSMIWECLFKTVAFLNFFFPGVYCIIPSLGSRKWILLIRQIKCLLRPYEHNADCRQDLPWELRGWNTPTTINWHSLPTLGYMKWYSPHGSVVLALQIGAVPSLVHRRLLGQMCAFIILVLWLLCNNLCFGEQSCQ